MGVLHVLAILSATVLGLLGWSQFDAGLATWWQAALLALFGAVLPYGVALGWALSVAPSLPASIRSWWAARRRTRAR